MIRPLVGLLVLAISASGCAPAAGRTSDPESITVLAAASLTETFTRIAADVEAAHPGSRVVLSFGSSSALAVQINAGAPADVFAAADEATMASVRRTGAVTAPTPFASNTLQIAVPAGNPGRITGLADFADARRRIALCAPQVPCGAAAATVFARAGITPRPDTLDQDAKATLQKVATGEVDAALVYRTDVRAAAGQVEPVEVAQTSAAVNTYPIAVLASSRNPVLARAFVDHVRSVAGQAVLREAGFGPA